MNKQTKMTSQQVSVMVDLCDTVRHGQIQIESVELAQYNIQSHYMVVTGLWLSNDAEVWGDWEVITLPHGISAITVIRGAESEFVEVISGVSNALLEIINDNGDYNECRTNY